MNSRSSIGGSAAQRGIAFENSAAAWIAVHVLAEESAPSLWRMASNVTLEEVHCQTSHYMDDLLILTSEEGRVFVQVKLSVRASRNPRSALGSAVGQIVQQYLAMAPNSVDAQEPPLDPIKDRLLLMLGHGSSQPMSQHLPSVLRRVRDQQDACSLDGLCRNRDEHRAWAAVLGHTRRVWQQERGEPPSDSDLKGLLSLLHVQMLELDDDGRDRQQAEVLLRSVVLQDPTRAGDVWSQLVEYSAQLASRREGANREGLQRALTSKGIGLRSVRSYESDIGALKEYSQQMLVDNLADLAELRMRQQAPVRIKRECLDSLFQAAMEGSLLVTGEPGAGKSGVLHDLAQLASESGVEFALLSADRLSESQASLVDVAVEHRFEEVLGNWFGEGPALLIVDALDAARSEDRARRLTDVIKSVMRRESRWRVIAAIRQFDLRYSEGLRELFAGVAPLPDGAHADFSGVRHVLVKKLTDGEIEQVRRQSPELAGIIDGASPELRELLQVPFNLRLVTSLLNAGVSADKLTPIQTQIGLLEKYWTHRVVQCSGEEVLRAVCDRMVLSRDLRTDRSVAASSDRHNALQGLLSNQVLQEWRRAPGSRPVDRIIAFSHHMLFDYAVARLLLEGPHEPMIDRLVAEPDLVMAIRPSLMWRCRRLWSEDRQHRSFWDLACRMLSTDGVPAVGGIAGPTVAVELSKAVDDLAVLIEYLQSSDPAHRSPAEEALRHLVGALHTVASGQVLVGDGAGPWCALAERLSQVPQLAVVGQCQSLLRRLCDNPEMLTNAQMQLAGAAARRLLDFADRHQPRNSWLTSRAMECVCRTFASNADASAELLRRSIDPRRIAQHGYEETPVLAREIKRLIPHAPVLVRDIYQAAFTFEEPSSTKTPIGASRILPLTSTKSQDYRMGLYRLKEAYSDFLQAAPVEAAGALVEIVNGYVERHHRPYDGEWDDREFGFRDQRIVLRVDLSSIWDQGAVAANEDCLIMLTCLQHYVESIGNDPIQRPLLAQLVGIFLGRRCAAVLMRRLMLAAAKCPQVLGLALRSLLWERTILDAADTSYPAGKLLKTVYPSLGVGERERVEHAILSVPEGVSEDRREAFEHARNCLLGCLTPNMIVTPKARALVDRLRDERSLPVNEPPPAVRDVWRGFSEDEHLAEMGVDLSAQETQELQSLIRPVQEFANEYANSVPDMDAAAGTLQPLQALHRELRRGDRDHTGYLAGNAWDALAAACGRVAKMDELPAGNQLRQLVRQVLLEAGDHPHPVPDPEADRQFDDSCAWSSPAPRLEAGRGLVLLARHPGCQDDQVLGAIEKLAGDPKPQVRFHVAERLLCMYHTAPDLMWGLVNRLGKTENSRGVLWALLIRVLCRIADRHPDQVVPIVRDIMGRASEGPGSGRVMEACMSIVTDLYVWQGNEACREMLCPLVNDPVGHYQELWDVVYSSREALTHGEVGQPDPESDQVRDRAFTLLDDLLTRAQACIARLEEEGRARNWPEEVLAQVQPVVQLVDRIGSTVYFASGTHEPDLPKEEGERGPSGKQRERFYEESQDLVAKLARSGLPSVTHRLVEMLEYFVPAHPRDVFLRIGDLIQAGQAGEYQHESMAVGRVVELVERYLAEYRWVFQQHEDCRKALIGVLDIFVNAGWPEARRLAFRLEDIYR